MRNDLVVLETDPDNCQEFDSWRKAGMTVVRDSGPVMDFGRKPRFKNLLEITEQDVESLKYKQSQRKPI